MKMLWCFQKDISDKSKTQLRHIQKIMKDIELYFTKKFYCNIIRNICDIVGNNYDEGQNNARILEWNIEQKILYADLKRICETTNWETGSFMEIKHENNQLKDENKYEEEINLRY